VRTEGAKVRERRGPRGAKSPLERRGLQHETQLQISQAAPGTVDSARVSRVAREILLVFAAVALVTALVTFTPSPLVADYGALILSAVFLFGALTLARREGGARRFGIDLCGLLEAPPDEREGARGLGTAIVHALPRLASELAVALGLALVIFPPFVPAFMWWHGTSHPFTLHFPARPLDFVLHQVIVVALPEEALFRGYFQTRLEDLYPRNVRVFGVAFSPMALLLQAVLFALLHFLVGFAPGRLSVFFPALAFGFLRTVRGGIGAAIWFHALSNILSELLTRGFL
jgi:membrane protease YdiL (CAAX protease family)